MKHLLNGNLKVWHLIAFGVVMLLFGGGATVLAGTSGVAKFWHPGDFRLASASADDTKGIPGNTQEIVLSASINVPEGKKADLQATFSADLHPGTTIGGTFAFCFGQFGLDNTVPDAKFKPGDVSQLLGGEIAKMPQAVTVAMTGYRKNISAGTHTVNVYVSGSFDGCTLFARNLNLVASVH